MEHQNFVCVYILGDGEALKKKMKKKKKKIIEKNDLTQKPYNPKKKKKGKMLKVL